MTQVELTTRESACLLSQAVDEFASELREANLKLVKQEKNQLFEEAAATRDFISKLIENTSTFIFAITGKEFKAIKERLIFESNYVRTQIQENYEHIN